jgi:hypothetical protein
MKKKSFVIGAALALALGAIGAPPAHAACVASTSMNHLFVPFINCPDPDPGVGGPDPAQMSSYRFPILPAHSNGLGWHLHDINRPNGIVRTARRPVRWRRRRREHRRSVQTAGLVRGCPTSTYAAGDNPVAQRRGEQRNSALSRPESHDHGRYIVDLAFPTPVRPAWRRLRAARGLEVRQRRFGRQHLRQRPALNRQRLRSQQHFDRRPRVCRGLVPRARPR